jgi:dTDP-4-dehydrorhamnose 3,5-epimerase
MPIAATPVRQDPRVSSAPDVPRLILPRRHYDERGWFCEIWSQRRLVELGINCDFVQDNQSYSKKAGTVRGLHFQRPPAAQAKLVSVLQGRILDVIVDLRRGSSTYGKYMAVELSAQDGAQLYIPVGYAHGFCTLEDEVHVLYKASQFYAPACESGVRFDDEQIGVNWPFATADLTISKKDRELPPLEDFISPYSFDGYPMSLSPTSQL